MEEGDTRNERERCDDAVGETDTSCDSRHHRRGQSTGHQLGIRTLASDLFCRFRSRCPNRSALCFQDAYFQETRIVVAAYMVAVATSQSESVEIPRAPTPSTPR